ncbi:FimD/usher-like TcfC protein [Enterobacter sp. AG5470]|nr:FimD/usher-like TcfC protein [Enterobacter sp. AG5470]
MLYNHLQKILNTLGIVLFTVSNSTFAVTSHISQIGGIIIPKAFDSALRDGMAIPLFLHLDGVQNNQDDQRIGTVSILLINNAIHVHQVTLEERDNNSSINEKTRHELSTLKQTAFDQNFVIRLSQNARLYLNFQQLTLQLIVRQQALQTHLLSRSDDIGKSSGENISHTISYNLGIYNNQMRDGKNNTSSYLSMNNVTALREHHIAIDGTLYGIGTNRQQKEIYKAMYERDFAGYRFAGGMLDTWNMQSLGPITAITSGKIYGISWGNNANSTVFDSSYSTLPVIVFLPSAGEVHLSRDGKLLSVQNFGMGSHEVDTRGLPYGIYDISTEVIVNGQTVSKTIQRINKFFAHTRGAGMPVGWQIWGGSMQMNAWSTENGEKLRAKNTVLMGLSAAGGVESFSWMATGYNYNALTIGEAQLSWPIASYMTLSMQNMLSTDRSWSSTSSLSATLPGGFSSVWFSQDKAIIGNRLRRNGSDNRAIGASLNLNAIWPLLGTISGSYNDDRRYRSHYFTSDYTQSLYNGQYGSLGMRAGIQRYESGYNGNRIRTEKYIGLDFTLPLGGWLRTGLTHQNGSTIANLSAQKYFQGSVIRTVGANLSRAISGTSEDNDTLSGGAWTKYETRYSSGTLNINSGMDGYINTNLTASGSIGWVGKHIAASGNSEGNAGVIFNTDVNDEGKLTARINGRTFQLSGKQNYIPLEPYNRYDVEINNSKDSLDSYDIVSDRKTALTLYPGNLVLIRPSVRQMVTVFGRMRAEDGTLLTHVQINNHIGKTTTDSNGEFIIDIDKNYPDIDFIYRKNKSCEASLDIQHARGAIWVGDIVCQGLKTYTATLSAGIVHED